MELNRGQALHGHGRACVAEIGSLGGARGTRRRWRSGCSWGRGRLAGGGLALAAGISSRRRRSVDGVR
jgi:hypothetical protein